MVMVEQESSVLSRIRSRVEELARESMHTARQISERIWEETPELWLRWFDEHGRAATTAYVGDVLRVVRLSLAAERPRDIFAFSYVVDDENHRKPFGELSGPDCRFVAGAYRTSAGTMKAKANLFNVLAKKVGGRRVRDVFTAEQLVALFGQFGIQLEEAIDV